MKWSKLWQLKPVWKNNPSLMNLRSAYYKQNISQNSWWRRSNGKPVYVVLYGYEFDDHQFQANGKGRGKRKKLLGVVRTSMLDVNWAQKQNRPHPPWEAACWDQYLESLAQPDSPGHLGTTLHLDPRWGCLCHCPAWTAHPVAAQLLPSGTSCVPLGLAPSGSSCCIFHTGGPHLMHHHLHSVWTLPLPCWLDLKLQRQSHWMQRLQESDLEN